MMNQREIKKLFQNELGLKVISIVDKSKGVDQEVSIVKTNAGKFVLKIPHKDKTKIAKEILGTKLCSKIGVPVPKVIFSNKILLIETYVDGTDLDELKTTKKNFENIYLEIGQLLNKMHSIKAKRFGSVNKSELVGVHSTQEKAILDWFVSDFNLLKKTKYYSAKEISKMENYFEINKNFLKTKESVFLHFDIYGDNIVIRDGKVAGIIDFGDLSCGSPMSDFSIIYKEHFGDYKFEKVLEGYGAHNLNEIKFYAFCWFCWRLRLKIEDNDFGKGFKRMEKLAFDICR